MVTLASVSNRLMPIEDIGTHPAARRSDMIGSAWAIFKRRWLIFVVMVATIIGLVAAYTARQTPYYTATANILVNSRQLNIVSQEDDVIPKVATEQGAVDTEIQILKSREVAAKVAETLNLAKMAEFGGDLVKSPAAAEARAIGVLMQNLKIDRPGATNVLAISYTSANPDLAAVIANTFADQYVVVKDEARLNAVKTANTGLTRELDILRDKVEAAEAEVARYKAANNLLSTDGVTLTEQEISIYNQQVATARATLAEETARLNTARSQLARGSKGDDVGEALNSSVVEQLRGQRAQISNRLADLQTRYRDSHPDVIKTKQQLNDIDNEIHSEITRIVSNLEARVHVARQRATSVEGNVSNAKSTLASNNAASVRLNELDRRAQALRSNYEAMLTRMNAVSTQALVADSDSRLFSSASVPRSPSRPNWSLNLVVGALLALCVATGTIWLLEMFEAGVTTSRDVETIVGLPHIVNVPSIRSITIRRERGIPPHDFIAEKPFSLFADAVRGVRMTLLDHAGTKSSKVLGLTSAVPGEGKSTLSVCLARASAMAGSRTVLLDGDLRRPMIAQMLGLQPKADLVEVLGGVAELSEALIEDPVSGAYILPTLGKTFTPNDIFNAPPMSRLLSELKTHFDVIIIDAAPALSTVDARMLLKHLDAVALVIKWRTTPVSAVQAALKKLEPLGIRLAGAVLSQVDMKAIAKFGYGDVDYNHRNYKAYFE